MNNFKEITGNLLDQRDGVICHQCNCTSRTWSGLAAAIFNEWPECNTYQGSWERNQGEIHWFKVQDDTWVANIYSQYNKGKANDEYDNVQNRLYWFEKALVELKYSGFTNFFFPKYYGSGLAGGDWKIYRQILVDFAKNNPTFTVTIVGLQE